MKRLFLLAILIAAVLPILPAGAQILNPGFESWTAGEPNNWYSSNLASVYAPVTQSNDAHTGASSLKGTVVSYLTVPVTPSLLAGTDGSGFTATGRYGSVTGYFKFAPVSGDSFAVLVFMFKAGSGIGSGIFGTRATVSSYTQFTVPISYFLAGTPDTAWIEIYIVPPTGQSLPHIGSAFTIDDIAYGPVTSVSDGRSEVPASFNLAQNYPNPFNPATRIDYSIAKRGHVSLKIYDVLGNEVATLVDRELERGSYSAVWNATNSPSGVYFYRLTSGSFSTTKKLLLMR